MEQNANMVLPPVVKFEGVCSAVSVYRLATFTGTRFFRSCALNVHCSTTPSAPAQPLTRSSSNHSAKSMPGRTGSTAAAAAAAGCRGASPSKTAAEIFGAGSNEEADVTLSSPAALKVGSAPTMPSSGLGDEEPTGARPAQPTDEPSTPAKARACAVVLAGTQTSIWWVIFLSLQSSGDTATRLGRFVLTYPKLSLQVCTVPTERRRRYQVASTCRSATPAR